MGLRAICIHSWWHSWVVLMMYTVYVFPVWSSAHATQSIAPRSTRPTSRISHPNNRGNVATRCEVLYDSDLQSLENQGEAAKLLVRSETSLRQVRPCDSCGEMRKTTNFSRGEEVPFLVLQRCSNTKRKWLSEAVLDWVPMALCCLSAHQWRLDEVDEGREFPDATWALNMF